MPCYHPLEGYKDKYSGGWKHKRDDPTEIPMAVPCLNCLGCRLDKSRMWAMRIIHESTLPENDGGNIFITLTYRSRREATEQQLKDGEHIPDDWSLHKSHFQKFMKRLRKKRKNQRIRMYHCGEYGNVCRHNKLSITADETLQGERCDDCRLGRPHYHAIIFNCDFRDRIPIGGKRGRTYYTSKELEEIWKYGHVQVADLSWEGAAYVARYCLKKITGKKAYDHYLSADINGEPVQLLPEYATMSTGRRCPKCKDWECANSTGGIGRKWYERFKYDCYPSDTVWVPGQGNLRGLPRYYDKLFSEDDPGLHEEVKALRKAFRDAHAEEYTPARLKAKYQVKKAQITNITRGL